MLYKTIGKLIKDTKKLWSVEIKYKRTRAEGQECEGSEVILEHSRIAVDFMEVGCDEVARVVLVKALEIMRSKAWKVEKDESEVEGKIMKQSFEIPASDRIPSLLHYRVNLAGRCARNHPGQSQKNLWERHTTRKVVQQQIMFSMYKGKGVGQVARMMKTVNVMIFKMVLFRKYRSVQVDMVEKAGVVANPGDSGDKFKKCERFLSLFCSSSTRRDPGVYHTVTAVQRLEHIVSHAMESHLFL